MTRVSPCDIIKVSKGKSPNERKVKTMKIQLTKHAKEDRIERMLYITQTIGFGERIVCEGFRRDKGTRQCLSETGILIVKMPESETMVTAYIPTLEQAGMIYKSAGLHMPNWMAQKIKKNQKYAKGCPA